MSKLFKFIGLFVVVFSSYAIGIKFFNADSGSLMIGVVVGSGTYIISMIHNKENK